MQEQVTRPAVARREPEAVRRFGEGLEKYTQGALAMAEALRTIDVSAAFVFESCSSVREWAERKKLSASMARTLRELAESFEVAPALEEQVRRHEMSLEAAAAVGQVLAHPEMIRPGEDWVNLARTASTRDVGQAVRKRQAEEAARQRTYGLTFQLPHQDIVDFRQARRLACRSTHKRLSYEEAFVHVVRYFLDEEDPDRVKPGRRRTPDTTGASQGDWPAEVARDILARTEGKCLVATCDNDIFIDKAHDVQRIHGGGFEDGLPLCQPHHQDQGAGRLKNVGTLKDPILVALDGTVLYSRRRKPLVPPGSALPGPAPPDPNAGTRRKPP